MIKAPLVFAWCDDLFLQGHQLARWITDYVDLEESLAMGTVAQEHLAHAAALLGVCGMTPAERDRHVYERSEESWFPSALTFLPSQDWSGTVAHSFLLNQGVMVMRAALNLPDLPRVQQLAEVIRAEQDVHARHWSRWLTVFASDAALTSEFDDRLARAAEQAGDLFGFPAGSSGPDGLLGDADPVTMQRKWADSVRSALSAAGLACPDLPEVPRERRPGDAYPELKSILTDLRFARGPDGSRHYEVYR